MARMKRFFLYFLMFIAFFIFVSLFTNIAMKERFEDITNHEINISSPKIIIMESKASYSSGYIRGTITNNTGEHIKDKYLQFDFYDKDGIYLGTESKDIKYFNVDEKISFDINYTYRNVNKIKISFVDEVTKIGNNNYNIFNFSEEEKKLIVPVALIVGLYAILP